MTGEDIKNVITIYVNVLMAEGGRARRIDDNPPVITREMERDHLLWMCTIVPGLVDQGRIEKAMRWLGFIQGVLWSVGMRSLSQMKCDNMPPDEEFDGKRV